MSRTASIVLAAGVGSRMRSAIPKPLHHVGGLPLLGHVLASAAAIEPDQVVVVTGPGVAGRTVAAAAAALRPDVAIAVQDPARGTGDAVRCGMAALTQAEGDLLVLYADTPFIAPQTLLAMRAARRAGAAVVVLGFETAAPTGYGRLMTGPDGALARIVEEADATPAERAATLCNGGIMMLDAANAGRWLAGLAAGNAQGETYLTDLVAAAGAEGRSCAIIVRPESETIGVNDRAGLAAAEAAFQSRARAAAMAGGATLTDPASVFFSWDTVLAEDVEVAPNVVFGPGVRVGRGARIRAFCHLEGCTLADGAEVGPFARLRPGAALGPGARVGNFVEIKNADLGAGAKVNHLSYVGDAEVGENTNLGAGTVTCNYDGVFKHRTVIGRGAFIGSSTMLVAPVTIGAGAMTASGSVITSDVPDGALALGRAKQVNKPGLALRMFEKLKALKASEQKVSG